MRCRGTRHATASRILTSRREHNADRNSALYTDQSKLYTVTGEQYASRKTTNHSGGEYVRYENGASLHSNTIENVLSVFKRGMTSVYKHCGEAYLHRYLAEFDFRYNRRAALKVSDAEHAEDLLRKARDRRLTYQRMGEAGLA